MKYDERQVQALAAWLQKTFGPGEDELVAASHGRRDAMDDGDWAWLARRALEAVSTAESRSE